MFRKYFGSLIHLGGSTLHDLVKVYYYHNSEVKE